MRAHGSLMTSNGLVPLIRYRDVSAAIAWLVNAFGFEERNVVNDPDGTVAYAELAYGRGVVMLGPVGQSVLDSLLKQPDELDGIGTQTVYVAVDDVEGHFKRARAAGADIVLEFGSNEAGDRAYAARDLEGHIWNFGVYSPFPAAATPPLPAAAELTDYHPSRWQAVLGGAVAALAIATVAGLAMMDPPKPKPSFALKTFAPSALGGPSVAAAPSNEDPAREAASLRATLEREAHARQEAARVAAAVREELARERSARQAADAARAALEKELARTRQTRSEPAKPALPKPAAAPAIPAASAPAAASATPPATAGVSPSEPTPPTTTGSLGEQPRNAANEPTAVEPAPPVTVGPRPPAQVKTPPPAPSAAKTTKPKTARQTRAPAPKKPQRRNSGNDPFFLYD